MVNDHIISMPDKWEYPWYAAWDLAFHTIALVRGRPGFCQRAARPDADRTTTCIRTARSRLRMELQRCQPAGPCLGDAVLCTGRNRPSRRRRPGFSEAQSFASWRSTSPGGSTAKTASARTFSRAAFSGWTTSACLTAARRCPRAVTSSRRTARPGWRCSARTWLDIAVRTGRSRPGLRGHWPASSLSISCGSPRAMNRLGQKTACGMRRTGSITTCCGCRTAAHSRLKVRSMVGLLPLCAATAVERWQRERVPQVASALPGAHSQDARVDGRDPSYGTGALRSCGPRHHRLGQTENRLRRILAKMLDENEFLSPYGIRALSRYHADHPYVLRAGGQDTGSTICRRNQTAACSAATPTGVDPSGSRSTP